MAQFKSADPFRKHPDLRICLILAVMLVARFPEIAQAQSPGQFPRTDFQSWFDLYEVHPLSKHVCILGNGGLRVSHDAGHLVYRRFSAGAEFKVNKFLILSPYYSHYSTDSSPLRVTAENRLSFSGTVRVPVGRWKLSERTLAEKRYLSSEHPWRYRQQLKIARNIETERGPLSVYLWDELFFEKAAGDRTRNRIAVGLQKQLCPKIALELYGVRQNDGYLRPGDLTSFGIAIHSKF